jgi:hypothetical protein
LVGRDRAFSAIERVRLAAVFQTSVGPLAGSLLLRILLRAGWVPDDVVVSIAGAYSVLFILATVPVAMTRSLRLVRATKRGDPWAIYAVMALGCVQLLLYLAVLFQRVGPAGIAVGYSIQLVVGVWMFWRLLTLPD